jgi:hypothetical protein
MTFFRRQSRVQGRQPGLQESEFTNPKTRGDKLFFNTSSRLTDQSVNKAQIARAHEDRMNNTSKPVGKYDLW